MSEGRLERIAPGLRKLLHYQRADLPHDVVAGLAVAAVAIPGSIANAQLAGPSPAVGLDASTLPLVGQAAHAYGDAAAAGNARA